ncbi:MAG: replication protein RepA [Terracidiphilus sp.]
MQLVDTRLLIQETTAFEAGQLGFIARILAQSGLPYNDLGSSVHVYERSNGRFSLRIVSHAGIPYGTIPRILLAFASTEAVRTKSPYIYLGKNLSSLLRDKLHLSVTGGKRGNITRLKQQAYRLFSSQISLTKRYSTAREGHIEERYMNISEGQDLSWWLPQGSSEESIFSSQIKLSQQFYDEVTTSPVPIDWRAVAVLKNSAMALDLYFWLTHRMKYLKETTTVPWFGEFGLYGQLGSTCNDDHRGRFTFTKNVTAALAQVLTVYPEARVESVRCGLVLRPSPTHVTGVTVLSF